ncbi:unnamed protein product [Mytilus edulis]|uniref:Uncharacterized protein n=1 Tax=Mytilus edulis TaxID=6550 RepID=A0A8S3QS30_MYTED|nr:unnamed protein product [Mytilus edulis]
MLINCLNDHELENVFLKIVAQVASEIEKQVKISCNELDSFVERSTLKDVMLQWTEKIEIKREDESRNENKRTCENLAVEMQGTIPERDKLEEKFNHFWSSWINQLGIKDDTEVLSIADQIKFMLHNKFSSDAAFFNANPSCERLRKLEGSISSHQILTEHFSRHNYLGYLERDFRQVQESNCGHY